MANILTEAMMAIFRVSLESNSMSHKSATNYNPYQVYPMEII